MSLNFENVGKNVIYNRSVDNIEDYVKGTIVGCYIGEDEEYYVTSIESSGECLRIYDDSLLEIIEGGGSVTPQGIVDATAQMTLQQAADTRQNIGAVDGAGAADYINNYGAGDLLPKPREQEEGKVLTASDDGTADWVQILPTTVTVSGSTPSIAAEDNTIYECGELTSLTVSSIPASGWFEIDFDSGATATVLSLPNDLDVRMPSGFSVEADTHYEINVKNGWPMVGSCPIPPAT